MAINDIVNSLVTKLREAGAAQHVEAYWRTDPPTGLTVYVQPQSEGAEQALSMSDFDIPATVSVIIETPWKSPETEGPKLIGAVEVLKQVIANNRCLLESHVTMFGGVNYMFAQRPGRTTPCMIADCTVQFIIPQRGGR